MRLRIGVLAVFIVLSSGVARAVDMSQLAPADEYFGRLKMSILGIANTIRDAAAKLDRGGDPASVIDGPLAFTEDAIHAWERRYPNDPWIRRDLWALERVYERIPTPRGQALAQHIANWLARNSR